MPPPSLTSVSSNSDETFRYIRIHTIKGQHVANVGGRGAGMSGFDAGYLGWRTAQPLGHHIDGHAGRLTESAQFDAEAAPTKGGTAASIHQPSLPTGS
ncbi:hypothetical protein Axi01nite_94180 [Actinoplanes xinjiangensis]|nr:hypothetical protein Axi01nite_94180 [Actinoplanes xinjiangensis]